MQRGYAVGFATSRRCTSDTTTLTTRQEGSKRDQEALTKVDVRLTNWLVMQLYPSELHWACARISTAS